MPNLKDSLTQHRTVQSLTRLLRALFRQQAMEVASKITLESEEVPDLTGWVKIVAEASKPMLLRLTQQGIAETQLRLARKLGRVPSGSSVSSEGLRSYRIPTSEIFGVPRGKSLVQKTIQFYQQEEQPTAQLSFNLFNPRVIDAVDAAAFAFCRETMETARTDLNTALRNLRQQMRQGLQRGEALSELAKKVTTIFSSPARAFRIAVTEASRAQHAGQLMAAKESGVVSKKSWLSSSDACEQCLELGDHPPIPLDQPFYIDRRGGPYAIVHAPPLHPHCMCSMNEEIE